MALVAVDRGGGEGGRRARMGKKARQKLSAQRREHVVVTRREGVGAPGPLAQRLMQVPAARHPVLELGARHERRVITFPPPDLFHGAAEQQHRIAGLPAHPPAATPVPPPPSPTPTLHLPPL